MAIQPDYTSGTVTLTAASTAAVGVGTAWLSAGIRSGDEIMRAGRTHIIAAVVDDTHLTLAEAWSGATMAGVPYAIRFQPDGSRYTAAARALVEKLGNGIVDSIASLTGAADKLFYFTGATTFATLDFPAWARSFVSAANQGAGQTALGMSALMKLLLATTTGSMFLITLGAKEVLTANRSYYVRSDGNDSNTGLADNAGGAFLTKQRAYNVVRSSLDFAGYTVTIIVRAGTYAPLTFNSDWVGGGNLVIEGDVATPTNVHVSSTTATSFRVAVPISAPIAIRGFQLTFAGAAIAGVSVEASCRVNLQSIRFNGGSTSFAGCIRAVAVGAVITLQGAALSFVGSSASSLLQASDGGQINNVGAVTFTITGTPAWSWVGVVAGTQGMISFAVVTFSGAATGVRYSAGTMSLINTGGGGANFFPGSGAGSTSGGAQYI